MHPGHEGQRIGIAWITRDAPMGCSHRVALPFEFLHTRHRQQRFRVGGRATQDALEGHSRVGRVVFLEEQLTGAALCVEVVRVGRRGAVERRQRRAHRLRIAHAKQHVGATGREVFVAVACAGLLVGSRDACGALRGLAAIAAASCRFRGDNLGGPAIGTRYARWQRCHPARNRRRGGTILSARNQRRHSRERRQHPCRLMHRGACHTPPPAARMALDFSASASNSRSSSAS